MAKTSAVRKGISNKGLCADCAHSRPVKSDRGSTFLLCELSTHDPSFPKYPRLPVLSCRGYEQRLSVAEEASGAAPAANSDGVGTIIISSVPDGAEILVDEKFHGNTPATLRLPTGSHAIVLKFPGRMDWKRALEVLKSSRVTLRATLDRAP